MLDLEQRFKNIIYQGISKKDNLPDLNDMTDRGPKALKPWTAFKTVSIMGLIEKYQPQSEDELLNLFQKHSKKTIEQLTYEVYQHQVQYFGHSKYGLETIFKYCYCCIIINSFCGYLTEQKFDLWAKNKGLRIRLPDRRLDSIFHTDRILLDQYHQPQQFISIKPFSFSHQSEQYVDVFEGLHYLSDHFKKPWIIYYDNPSKQNFSAISYELLSSKMKQYLDNTMNYRQKKYLLEKIEIFRT